MKNKIIFSTSLMLGVILSLTSIFQYSNSSSKVKIATAITSTKVTKSEITVVENNVLQFLSGKVSKSNITKTDNLLTTKAVDSTKVNTAVKVASNTQDTTLSRGGSYSVKKPTSKAEVEVLDWWSKAQYVFERDSVADVTDVYSGKTFKVVRTMGSNHVDAEALTKKDTAIIKNIWGGFSWDRRPVIVNINGRKLAASMSAMPHAGLDSKPAYAVVSNRSDGYGKGENLDVIKNNDMDGHFDIHFLNSTRHKDDKKDPEHQAAIKIAASTK